MIIENSDIFSKVFAAILQSLSHLFSIPIMPSANVKEDGFGSLHITSKVALRNIKVPALCNKAGKLGDSNGGTVGGRQGDMEEGGRQGGRGDGHAVHLSE